MTHDRIHAVRPHDAERFRVGRIVAIETRDGHCVVTVSPETDVDEGPVEIELTVTLAIRDLFVSRLALADGDSPVGERLWYREYGGS